MRRVFLALVAYAACMVSVPAFASIQFDQTGDRLGSFGSISDFGSPVMQTTADDFSFISETTINQLTFSGVFDRAQTPMPSATRFFIRFFGDTGGTIPQPDISNQLSNFEVFVTGVDTGIDACGHADFGCSRVYNFNS